MTYCTTFKNINALFNPTETAPPATVDVIYPSNYINEIKKKEQFDDIRAFYEVVAILATMNVMDK